MGIKEEVPQGKVRYVVGKKRGRSEVGNVS